MAYSQIGDTHIFIGQYPQTVQDVQKLVQAGINGVLNVQTEEDFKIRGINWEAMQRHYKTNGIKAIHFPITDFHENDLVMKLAEAASLLNDMINN